VQQHFCGQSSMPERIPLSMDQAHLRPTYHETRTARVHVTEQYHLGISQAEVDFVDVDTATDNPIFIDPRAVRIRSGDFFDQCAACLVSYFTEVLDAIKLNQPSKVRSLMRRLGEPNETHLGFSKGPSRGRGLRGEKSDALADSITRSRAAKTGLLKDLEDTSFLVPGIGRDLLSDMTTQIIRGPLVEYTQRMCDYYDIPMEVQYSGHIWNADSLDWKEDYVRLPRTSEGTLLLIPKTIVRHQPIFNSQKYFTGYLAPILEDEELRSDSQLVSLLKDGNRVVDRAKLRGKYGDDKDSVVKQTLRLNKVPLENYRANTAQITAPPLLNEDIAGTIGAQNIDFMGAYRKIKAIAPGPDGATLYHRAVRDLLTALFYPSLANVKIEREIHDGRKRIDITYDNLAVLGFFEWVNRGFHCPLITVECKNYARDLGNPELDQMIGRFSDLRGRLGLIVCRSFENKALFLSRCKDASSDRNGFIIALDDDDLERLSQEAEELRGEEKLSERFAFPLLRERFDRLISVSPSRLLKPTRSQGFTRPGVARPQAWRPVRSRHIYRGDAPEPSQRWPSPSQLDADRDVIGALAPVARAAEQLDVRHGVGAALAPRDDVVEVQVRRRAALAASAAVSGRDGDLDVLGDGPGVPLANRRPDIRDPELPAWRRLGPGWVGLPARRRRPAELGHWPPRGRIEAKRGSGELGRGPLRGTACQQASPPGAHPVSRIAGQRDASRDGKPPVGRVYQGDHHDHDDDPGSDHALGVPRQPVGVVVATVNPHPLAHKRIVAAR
jgi:hypothetical protein